MTLTKTANCGQGEGVLKHQSSIVHYGSGDVESSTTCRIGDGGQHDVEVEAQLVERAVERERLLPENAAHEGRVTYCEFHSISPRVRNSRI